MEVFFVLIRTIFINMAIKYGIDFPFMESNEGNFLKMTVTPEKEVRADLIHLLLTRKGSRYFLPDFGTRLYQFIFDQNDRTTHDLIESEIRESIRKYIPNLDLTSILVQSAEDVLVDGTYMPNDEEDERLFRVSDDSTRPYIAKVKINYNFNNGAFETSDFVIINL